MEKGVCIRQVLQKTDFTSIEVSEKELKGALYFLWMVYEHLTNKAKS